MEKKLTVGDVVRTIRSFAPEGVQESWDNTGLCIGDENSEVTGILVGFDCTQALVDEAVAMGANLIVTHHPLIFGGIKRILPSDPVGLAVIKAIRAGISVYAAHTSADKVVGGVSWAIAERMGLKNVRILDPDRAVSAGENEYGLGIIGDLPEPLTPEEALQTVKKAFGLSVIRSSQPEEGLLISRVAACGGAGTSLIEKARSEGAQLYLCGDVSYHHFFTPKGFMLMDIGHYESEIDIVDILFSLIKKNFHTFAVRIERSKQTNPIYYF